MTSFHLKQGALLVLPKRAVLGGEFGRRGGGVTNKHISTPTFQTNGYEVLLIAPNFRIGVSMFNPTREHDTNSTRVFSG